MLKTIFTKTIYGETKLDYAISTWNYFRGWIQSSEFYARKLINENMQLIGIGICVVVYLVYRREQYLNKKV